MVDRIWNDGRMIIGGDRDHFLCVRLYYSRGGMAYDDRGYYLSVSPVRREVKYGVALLSGCPSDGIRVLVKDVARKSAKATANADAIARSILDDIVDRVCKKNGIDRRDVGDLIIG